MKEELEFIREKIQQGSGVIWRTPIAFLIQKTPFAEAYGNSSLDRAGGYSIALKFWWHLDFEDEVILLTRKHIKDNTDGQLISINVLEFFTVIINYCAALTALESDKNITDDPHPVLLNITDNMSAQTWTRHTCKSSEIGKLLARFFCCLIMDSPLGVNSKWISTHDNECADDISRIKKTAGPTSSSQQYVFDYSTLQQKYPQLKSCRSFRPRPELLSLLWSIVLDKKWPDLEQVRVLKLKGLGQLIT